MNDFARINKGTYQGKGVPYSPQNIMVNGSGPYSQEVSDFAIAEFLIFNRKLSQAEYNKVEEYISKKYDEIEVEELKKIIWNHSSGVNVRNKPPTYNINLSPIPPFRAIPADTVVESITPAPSRSSIPPSRVILRAPAAVAS